MIANVTAKDRVESYIAGVLDGSIVVGRYVRLAIERHLADMQRQDSEGFPYYFDEEEAEKSCRFFPKVLKHSKGEWAGLPFDLEPWQCFLVWSVYGWKRLDGTRRFRRVILLVARKNGKTQLAAGVAHRGGVADNESVAEVYCAATKKEQALVLFDEAERMARSSVPLSKHSQIRRNKILFPKTGSKIEPLGSDKPFDGLNPHVSILDELHAWREHHRPFLDTMVTASGARRQPMLWFITTEGDGNSRLWASERDYAIGVLEGQHKDETVFGLLYCVDKDDDWQDKKCWAKANPNLGVSVKLEYLKEQANAAKFSVEKRNQFLRYHLNRVVSSTEWAIDSATWDRAAGQPSDWHDADAITAAFDIGGHDDLAGLAYCAKFQDGIEKTEDGDKPTYRYEFLTKAFLYSESKRDVSKMPWLDWIDSGVLRREEFVINSIKNDILSDHQKHNFFAVAYDPYNAQQLGEDLTAEGLNAVIFRQNFLMYNEPLHQFLTLLNAGKIRHNGDPLLKWCAGNLSIKRDSTDRWMPCKKTSKDKIDPLVACFMAFRVALLAPSKAKGSLFIF